MGLFKPCRIKKFSQIWTDFIVSKWLQLTNRSILNSSKAITNINNSSMEEIRNNSSGSSSRKKGILNSSKEVTKINNSKEATLSSSNRIMGDIRNNSSSSSSSSRNRDTSTTQMEMYILTFHLRPHRFDAEPSRASSWAASDCSA